MHPSILQRPAVASPVFRRQFIRGLLQHSNVVLTLRGVGPGDLPPAPPSRGISDYALKRTQTEANGRFHDMSPLYVMYMCTRGGPGWEELPGEQ